eukprot:TRINITY_DN11710_c0_g1_i1.p1 TRINITY_DN11710_c0_g1~~TRINITY_DN11710_c0_g1_i1.p1  ORF type:complete len:875 (+),score=145.33 TRINITY_DN11710_c0_g1_i1:59-2626(+)
MEPPAEESDAATASAPLIPLGTAAGRLRRSDGGSIVSATATPAAPPGGGAFSTSSLSLVAPGAPPKAAAQDSSKSEAVKKLHAVRYTGWGLPDPPCPTQYHTELDIKAALSRALAEREGRAHRRKGLARLLLHRETQLILLDLFWWFYLTVFGSLDHEAMVRQYTRAEDPAQAEDAPLPAELPAETLRPVETSDEAKADDKSTIPHIPLPDSIPQHLIPPTLARSVPSCPASPAPSPARSRHSPLSTLNLRSCRLNVMQGADTRRSPASPAAASPLASRSQDDLTFPSALPAIRPYVRGLGTEKRGTAVHEPDDFDTVAIRTVHSRPILRTPEGTTQLPLIFHGVPLGPASSNMTTTIGTMPDLPKRTIPTRCTEQEDQKTLASELPGLDLQGSERLREQERQRIFSRMAGSYQRLLASTPFRQRDAVLRDLPDILVGCLNDMFQRGLPYARQGTGKPFTELLLRKISYWISGIERDVEVEEQVAAARKAARERRKKQLARRAHVPPGPSVAAQRAQRAHPARAPGMLVSPVVPSPRTGRTPRTSRSATSALPSLVPTPPAVAPPRHRGRPEAAERSAAAASNPSSRPALPVVGRLTAVVNNNAAPASGGGLSPTPEQSRRQFGSASDAPPSQMRRGSAVPGLTQPRPRGNQLMDMTKRHMVQLSGALDVTQKLNIALDRGEGERRRELNALRETFRQIKRQAEKRHEQRLREARLGKSCAEEEDTEADTTVELGEDNETQEDDVRRTAGQQWRSANMVRGHTLKTRVWYEQGKRRASKGMDFMRGKFLMGSKSPLITRFVTDRGITAAPGRRPPLMDWVCGDTAEASDPPHPSGGSRSPSQSPSHVRCAAWPCG